MPTERLVPTAPARRSLIVALLAGVALGAGGLAVAQRQGEPPPFRVLRALSPDRSRIAIAASRACAAQPACVDLRLGPSEQAATPLQSLAGRSAEEIVWTADGSRVGFVVDAKEVILFDAASGKHAGTVRLLSEDAAQTRLARGITFSENGRAMTFDDCPRARAGCRAAFVGVPQ